MKRIILLITIVFSGVTTCIYGQPAAYRNPLNMADDILMNRQSYMPSADSLGANGVYMWPNPAKGKTILYVNSLRQRDQGKCVLYNSDGKVFLYQQVNNGTNTINFGNIPAGMYFLRVVSNDRFAVTQRLIVSQ